MIYIKPKELIEGFCNSEEYRDMNPEDLELIVTESYKELRRQMETLEKPFVKMPGMGIWFIKVWTILREKEKYENIVTADKFYYQTTKVRYTAIRDRMRKVHTMLTTEFYTRITTKVKRLLKVTDTHIFPTGPNRYTYMKGCRCPECREIQAAYIREYNKRKHNDTEGEVSTGLGEQRENS
jgi:hypothetical protein